MDHFLRVQLHLIASSNFSILIISCPAGTYSSKLGSSKDSDCIPCPTGSYSLKEGSNNSTDCLACPSGTYSPILKSSNYSCNACPAGAYSLNSRSEECTKCPTGTASSVIGANYNPCVLCPAGSYSSVNGSSICTKCPAGTFSDTVGATSQLCVQCARGTFSIGEGNKNCTSCPVGTFSNQLGSGVDSCVKCPAGSYSSTPQATECIKCPIGTYSTEVGSTKFQCVDCPVGTFSNVTGLGSVGGCTPCPFSYKSNTTGASSCIKCKEFCPFGSSSEISISFANELSQSVNPIDKFKSDENTKYIAVSASSLGFIFLVGLSISAFVALFGFALGKGCKILNAFDLFYHEVYDSASPGKWYEKKQLIKYTQYTRVGGVATVVVIVFILVMFSFSTITFFLNNVIVTDSLQSKEIANIAPGTFSFELNAFGSNSSCNFTTYITGFTRLNVGQHGTVKCSGNAFGCSCYWECEKCEFTNLKGLLSFQSSGTYGMINYTLRTPYFISDQHYSSIGRVLLDESSPTIDPTFLYFSIVPSEYSKKLWYAPLSDMFNPIYGYDKQTGYISTPLIVERGKTSGSGTNVTVDLSLSASSYIVKETLIQSLLNYIAQVGSLARFIMIFGKYVVYILLFLELNAMIPLFNFLIRYKNPKMQNQNIELEEKVEPEVLREMPPIEENDPQVVPVVDTPVKENIPVEFKDDATIPVKDEAPQNVAEVVE
jgi:hypothetical protein